MDNSLITYDNIIIGLNKLGIASYHQDTNQLVVSSSLPISPKSSNSLWVTFIKNTWYIVTWAPHAYSIPNKTDIVSLIYDCIKYSNVTIWDIPESIIHKYKLNHLTDSELVTILGM